MAPRYRVSCEVPTRMASRSAPASLVLLVSVFLLSGPLGHAEPVAQQVATIASDLPEYFPGDTVTLTGSGWTPQRNRHHRPAPRSLPAPRRRADVGGRRERNDHEHVVYAPTRRPRRDILRDGHGIAVRPAGHGHLQGQEKNLDRRRLHGLEHGRQLEPVWRARGQGRPHDSGWRFKRPLSGRQLGACIRRPTWSSRPVPARSQASRCRAAR